MQEKLYYDNGQQGIVERDLSIASCILVTFLVLTEVSFNKHFYLGNTLIAGRDIIYPLTLLIINIIAEMYGAQHAKTLIINGLYISIITAILLYIAQALPVAHNSPVSAQDFNIVLGHSPRQTISFLGIYLIGHLSSLYLFTTLKDLAYQQYFWLRNFAVNLYAQLIDVTLVTIFFHLTSERVMNSFACLHGTISQYFLRNLVALAGTLLLYLIVQLSQRQGIKY